MYVLYITILRHIMHIYLHLQQSMSRNYVNVMIGWYDAKHNVMYHDRRDDFGQKDNFYNIDETSSICVPIKNEI